MLVGEKAKNVGENDYRAGTGMGQQQERTGQIELDLIRARLEAATPLPWECDGFADSGVTSLALYEGTNQGRVIANDITRNGDADLLFNAPTDLARTTAALDMVLRLCAITDTETSEAQQAWLVEAIHEAIDNELAPRG